MHYWENSFGSPLGNLTQIVFNTFFRFFLNCYSSLHHLLHIPSSNISSGHLDFSQKERGGVYANNMLKVKENILILLYILLHELFSILHTRTFQSGLLYYFLHCMKMVVHTYISLNEL